MIAPGTLKLRPTSDQLRETLFNVIGPAIHGAVFLDVFAGTGAVGIEAISRGAREVIFIEKHRATAAALIRRNLTAFKIEAEICEEDWRRALRKLAGRGVKADFIFADPPYADFGALEEVLIFANERELLSPEGLVITEHAKRAELPEEVGKLRRRRLLTQGDSALEFFGR